MVEQIKWLPYRPSNGTEGEVFYEDWCCKCAKDAHMNSGKDWDACEPHEVCSIIGDTLAYDVKHPKYPKEWRRRADATVYPGAECTAFVSVGTPERCEHTADMFAVPADKGGSDG